MPRHGQGRWRGAAAMRRIGPVLLLLAAVPAGAQTEVAAPVVNLTQSGVPAEATAENGVLAREQALANGRRLAWTRLVAGAGGGPTTLSDRQIENLVSSIVIEQERPGPTRYSGRITVNFSAARVRGALGARAGLSGEGGGSAPIGATEAPPAPAPASTWLQATASYRSLGEWLEIRRRLGAAAPVASVEIQGIAVDAARLRIGLRSPPALAAGELASLGLALAPAGLAPGAAEGAPERWRLGLAGGG